MKRIPSGWSLLLPLVVLGALSFASCKEGATTTETDSGAGGGKASPEAGSAPGNPGLSSWNTTEWATPRGNIALQGRAHDRVPRNVTEEWKVTLREEPGEDGEEGDPIGIIGDPAIANGTVYVGDVLGNFYAFDARNGEQRWKFVTGDTIEGPPTVALGKVFVGSNDLFFYCLDEATGKEIWKVEGADKMSSGGTVIRSPDDKENWILVAGMDGVVRCLRIDDGGSEVWSYDTGSPINGSLAIIDGEYAVFGGCDMAVHTLNLRDGEVVHRVEVDHQITESIASVGKMTFSGNYGNQVVAADAFGDRPKWIYEDRDFPFMAAPAVNDEMVFIGSRDKHLHAIDQETGERAWKFKTGSRVEGGAIVFDDAVVFGSRDGRLYALHPKDGSEVWTRDLGEGLTSSPAFAEGRIVVGGEDGTLFSLVEGKQL